ncbi:MAG: hypothetical protein ACI4MT_00255 [Christensenellales bacterium]
MEKIRTAVSYVSAFILGLVTIITICCPCISVSVTLSDGNVQTLRYDAFRFMKDFSGVKGAGAGIFNGIISVFMLIIGIILLVYSLFLILEHFNVLHADKFKKIKKAEKILAPLSVSQLVLSLMSLILLAVGANKLTELSGCAVYTLGAGTVVLLIFAITCNIVPGIFSSDKKTNFKKIKFGKLSDKFKSKKRAKRSDIETATVSDADVVNGEAKTDTSNAL